MSEGRALQTVKALSLGAMLACTVFVFIPFTLYVGNIDEFTVSWWVILGTYLRPAVFIVGLAGLFGVLLNASLFQRYLVLLATSCILVWLQGNILVWEYGLLDGRSIDWNQGTWRGWVDLGLWVSVFAIALLTYRRSGKPLIVAAVAIFCIQFALLVFSGTQNAAALAEKSVSKTSVDAKDEIYRFSSDRNVLHIIADGFQSDVFEEIITDGDDGARYASSLDGFVFFKNNLGVFPLTHMSVPAILSGLVYRNHMPRNEFLDLAIGGHSILNVAYDAGYEVDLAVPTGLTYMYTKSRHTNAYGVPANHHVTAADYATFDSAKLIDLTLFRLSPHFVKEYIYNDQLWFVQSLLSNSSTMGLRFFSHNAFLREFQDNMSANRKAPVYKLIHLMLSHNPMVANKDCGYAGRVLPTERATVKVQARCGLGELVKLLDKMKQLGVYDKATIVLMADHGAWVWPTHLQGTLQADGKSISMMNPTTVAMALPLLAIKQAGARGPLQTSLAPTSIIDTPATIASILGLRAEFDGQSAFSLSADVPRQRRHYTYQYSRSEWTAEYLAPIQELIVDGSPFESSAWRAGDRFLPNGVLEKQRVAP